MFEAPTREVPTHMRTSTTPIAAAIAYAVTVPPHVNMAEPVVVPT